MDAVLDTLGPQETLRLSRIHIFHAESVATNIDRKLRSGKTCISYDEHDKPCWETMPVESGAQQVLRQLCCSTRCWSNPPQRSEVCNAKAERATGQGGCVLQPSYSELIAGVNAGDHGHRLDLVAEKVRGSVTGLVLDEDAEDTPWSTCDTLQCCGGSWMRVRRCAEQVLPPVLDFPQLLHFSCGCAQQLIAFVERYHNPERILSLCSSSTAYKGMRLDLHQYTSLEVCDCASLSASQELSM